MTQIHDPTGNVILVTSTSRRGLPRAPVEDRGAAMAIRLCSLIPGQVCRLARRSERAMSPSSTASVRGPGAAGVAAVSKAGCEPKRFVRELRISSENYQVGQEIKVGVFADVAAVDVTGTSIGRGYAGAMKRHNFRGQRASHGVKKVHRHIGGQGSSDYPARMFKGKRMAGQYGNARSTVRNLRVVRVDEENGLLLVCGAVPGPSGGYVVVRPTNKVPVPVPAAPE